MSLGGTRMGVLLRVLSREWSLRRLFLELPGLYL
jgi:hypothetical protein